MPRNLPPTQPLGSFSVGNVVSAGLRIYQAHFKLYFSLAFRAYLWVFLPVYGWAKWSALNALISRLAFGEVRERPETVSEARSHVDPKMWNLLGAGFLVGLILFGALLLGGIVFGIFVAVLTAFVSTALGPSPTIIFLSILLGAIAFFAFLYAYIWLYSRLSIVELPIAMENNVDATSGIGRSWSLTKGFARRLQWLFFIAFLVTLPISIVIQIATSAAQILLAILLPDLPELSLLLNYIIVIILSVASGSLLIPFWQSIKAVIYYDLRSRREGLGLQIRDSLSQEGF